ncbi:hypothetical protein A2U01_0056188, partial [Trifolium medium]|nr:hypothetical protein [Trifolium medium]
MYFVDQAGASLKEYKMNLELGRKKIHSNSSISSNEIYWSPPPANTIKINVDAHCNGDGRWGLGWVVRKEDGSYLGVATHVVRAGTAMEAEVMGIVSVLQGLNQYDGAHALVESDSSVVVKAMQTRNYPR